MTEKVAKTRARCLNFVTWNGRRTLVSKALGSNPGRLSAHYEVFTSIEARTWGHGENQHPAP